MAWGETHFALGALIGLAAGPDMVAPAAALSAMTHWPLDDLNVGPVRRVYHGIGESLPVKVLSSLVRTPIILALAYLAWQVPEARWCGLAAWLVCDHEWALNVFGKHGYGLHDLVWPTWLHREWGMVPLFVGLGLAVWIGVEAI